MSRSKDHAEEIAAQVRKVQRAQVREQADRLVACKNLRSSLERCPCSKCSRTKKGKWEQLSMFDEAK